MLLSFFLLLCILFTNGCVTPGIQNNQAGIRSLQKGHLIDAETEFKKAIEADPSNAKYHNNLGAAFFEQGRIEDALIEYKKAVELGLDESNLHTNLGKVYHIQGKLKDAHLEFKKALDIAPHVSGPHFNFINGSYDLDSVEKAISDLEEIIKDSKPEGLEGINRFFMSYQAIVYAHILQGKYEEAIKKSSENIDILSKVKTEKGGYVIPIVTPFFFFVSTVPKQSFNLDNIYNSFYNLRGLAYFRQGQYQKASEDFKKAIEKKLDSLSNLNLGRIMLEERDPREAIYYFRKTIEKHQYSFIARIYYSIALKLNGEHSKAEDEFQYGIKQSNNRINTNLKSSYEYIEALGFANQVWERWDEAIYNYKKVIQSVPNSGWAYRKLGEVYLSRKEKDLAKAALNRALELMPQDTRTINLLKEVEK